MSESSSIDTLYFIIYSAIFAVFIIYLLFFSSLTFGFIVSKVVSTFLLPKDTFLRVNSFHISLLSGKIAFRGLKFATKNTCLRVVEGTITFRYWSKKTRYSLTVNDDSPCRLAIHLEGVEYLVYNNSYRYDQIDKIIKEKNGETVQQQQQQQQEQQQQQDGNGDFHNNNNENAQKIIEDLNLPSVKDFVRPMFYRVFPASSLSVRKGCIMVSNPELPTMLVITFDKSSGVYTTEETSVALDYYRQCTQVELQNCKINLEHNKDYNGEEELYVERPQKEDFVTYAFESFKSVFKDFRFTFINTDESYYETSDLPRRKDNNKNNSTRKNQENEESELESSTFDYGKHTQLLVSPIVSIKYYSDVPGPVVTNVVDYAGSAPQWGIDIKLNNCIIYYGPWADRNRTLIHKFFFPPDYEAPQIYRPVIGEQRQCASFDVRIDLLNNCTFRIPFRELTKDNERRRAGVTMTKEEMMARKPGWVDIRLEENSFIDIKSPMLMLNERGSNLKIDLALNKFAMVTSITNTTLLTARQFNVVCDVHYPLVWNHLTEWNTSFAIVKPQIYLLSDHITLFKDLGSDWSAGEPADITMFIPKIFKFDFSLSNFKLFCNVNEQNIINQPNNLDDNAHYVFTGPFMKSNLILPYTSFQSPKTEITFDVRIDELALKLILPLYNTIRQHLEDIEMEHLESLDHSQLLHESEDMTDSSTNSSSIPHVNSFTSGGGGAATYKSRRKHIKGSSHFITSEKFTLNGKYLYHSKVDSSYLDSVVLNIHGTSPKVKLFGFYVRYFLFLKNNFFGYTSHIINLEKYKDNIEKQKEKQEQTKKKKKKEKEKEKVQEQGVEKEEEEEEEEEESDESESKELANGLEIYVSLKLEDASVYCPLGLYSSKQQATVALHEFLLEIRYLPTYLDLYADFSPMVLNIPVSGDDELELLKMSNLADNTGIGGSAELSRYIQINDFTLKMHFLYGPQQGGEANYADFVNVHIGAVSGHVLVSQITSLGIWIENFFFHLTNKDNALSTKLASKNDPVYSITKLNVDTISLYLYSSENISEIRFANGVSVHINSLIDQLSHNKVKVEVPELSFKHLVPCIKNNNNNNNSSFEQQYTTGRNRQQQKHYNKKWAEVGELTISTNLSIYSKEPNWSKDSKLQRQFLKLHDSENRLLSFLWSEQEDNDLNDCDFILPSIFYQQQTNNNQNNQKNNNSNHSKNISFTPINIMTPPPKSQSTSTTSTTGTNFMLSPSMSMLMPQQQQHTPASSSSPNVKENSISNSSSISFTHGQKLQSTPKSQQQGNSSFLYPIGSSNHILKWNANNSPISQMGQYGDFFNQIKQSKSNLDIGGSTTVSKPTGSNDKIGIRNSYNQALETISGDEDESLYVSDEGEDYQTPESSLHEPNSRILGGQESDSDSGGEAFETDDELYKTTNSFITKSQSSNITLPNSSNRPSVRIISTSSGRKSLKKSRTGIFEPKIEEEEEMIEPPDQSQSQSHQQSKQRNLNPLIQSLRNHLRTYFFNLSQARMDVFGLTSRSSSFVECASVQKRSSLKSSLFGKQPPPVEGVNVHDSIHLESDQVELQSSYMSYVSNVLRCLPPIPKRTKDSRLMVYKSFKTNEIDVNDPQLYRVDNEDLEDCDRHEKEFGEHTATTTICIDSMRDIELFATPVIVNILEELVESFIAKDPSIDYMLDNFQLRSISEQFKVKKYLHNKTRLTLNIHKFNLHWIQSLPIKSHNSTTSTTRLSHEQKVYITEIELDSIHFDLSTCAKQQHQSDQNHNQILNDHTNNNNLTSPSFTLPVEEFCSFETLLSIKSIHGCMRVDEEANEKTDQNYIPEEILSKYHKNHQHSGHRVIVSIGTDNIMIQGKFDDHQGEKITSSMLASSSCSTHVPNSAFSVTFGEISLFLTTDSPSVMFNVVDTMIFHISKLVSVFERYKELWKRQLQTLIGELLRSRSKSISNGLLQRSQAISHHYYPHHHGGRVEFIPPDFKEIIGDEALIHRLGWKDISTLREFMRSAERPNVDEVVADVSLAKQHDSYRTFQELINEIYEIDEGGELILLFQSPLIKKVFIIPPGKSTSFDINLEFKFEGILAAVMNGKNSITISPDSLVIKSNNQLSIGRFTGGAVANYIRESLVESSQLLPKSVSQSSGRSAFDINFFSQCQKVSLKISPDLLTFVQNTVDEIMHIEGDLLRGEELILGSHDLEWKPIRPSVQLQKEKEKEQEKEREKIITSPLNLQSPIIPPSTAGSPKSRHKATNSSPNLPTRNSLYILTNSPTTSANTLRDNLLLNPTPSESASPISEPSPTLSPTGTMRKTDSYESAQQKRKRNRVIHSSSSSSSVNNNHSSPSLTITVHGHFSFKELNLRAMTENNRKGVMRMLLRDLSFVFNEFGKSDSKKKAGGESRPNGDYIHMIHSCIFNVPEIQLQLLDQITEPTKSTNKNNNSSSSSNPLKNINYEKPIIELNIKNLMFNEVLFKTGKKKMRQISSGKREEYIEFSFKYDLMLTFEKADLPFKMSHRFLPKLKDFLKEWTPESPNKMAADPILPKSTTNNNIIGNLKFPPIRFKLDLKEILISTDALSSLPVTYHISRISASASQFSHDDMEFQIQLHQHRIAFSNRSVSSDPFLLPRIKAFGGVKIDRQSKLNVSANLEIGFIQNVVSIELLDNILVLRTMLSKEIDDLLNNLITKPKQPTTNNKSKPTNNNNNNNNISSSPTSSNFISLIRYNLTLVLRGFELLLANDSSSLLVSTGAIDVRVSNTSNVEMGNQIVNNNNTFNWKIGLRGLSLILTDPTFTLASENINNLQGYSRIQSMKSQIWAGIITDISLQSFPLASSGGTGSGSNSGSKLLVGQSNHTPISSGGGSSKTSSGNLLGGIKTSPLEKAWVVISKTVVTFQPWAIDKATNLWLFYYRAYQKTSAKLAKIKMPSAEQVKRALDTIDIGSTLPIKQTNLSLHIKIEDTSVCIPFNNHEQQLELKRQQKIKIDPNNNLTCSALIVSLGLFSLDGVAIKQLLEEKEKQKDKEKEKEKDKEKQPSSSLPSSSKEYPMKVYGDCKFNKFSLQFVDNYHPGCLDKIHTLRAVNRAVIDNGDCQIVNVVSPKLVQCFVQLKTSGLFLHLDTKLLDYIVSFQDLIYLGHEKLKNFQTEQDQIMAQQTSSSGINHSTPHRIAPGDKLKSSSQINLSSTPTTSSSHRLEIEFSLKTSVGEARLIRHTPEQDGSVADSPSLDGSFDKTERVADDKFKDYQECFQIPQLSISTTHVFSPVQQNLKRSKSETNIMLFLESQEIKLTPYFTHFLYDLVHDAPQSSYHQQFTTQQQQQHQHQQQQSQHNLLSEDTSLVDSNTTPGSVTFTIRINPTKVLLDGVDHILAVVEIGTIDIFFSSIIKDTAANRRVLLMNGTVALNNVIFRILHSGSSEERLGILLRTIQMNIGTCHGITDKGPVISILFNSDSSHGFVNSKYLDEILIFFGVWIPTKYSRDSSSSSLAVSAASSPKLQPLPTTTLPLPNSKSPQIYVTAKIGSIGLDIDFLPLSRFNMLINNICAVYSPNEEETRNSKIFFSSFYTGAISILCHGKLEGNLELEGIALVGERRPFKNTGRDINMWTASISPVRTSFDFNQSEILDLRSGDILFKFYDIPLENNQLSINLDISCSLLQVQLSCETIESIVEIIKRIQEIISDKVRLAKNYLTGRGGIMDRSRVKKIIDTLDQVEDDTIVPVVIGQIKVKGNNFNLLLFGFSIKDPTWISFTLESYQLVLDQSRKKDETHRQLSILLGQNHISKMTEQSALQATPLWARDPFSRRAVETKIVKIPVASLIMFTTEHQNNNIEFYYLTEFTDSIAISVNLNLYNDLREIVQTYIQAATNDDKDKEKEKSTIKSKNHNQNQNISNNNNVSTTPPKDYTSTSSEMSNFMSINNLTKSFDNRPQSLMGKKKRIFLEKKFQLSPTLNVLGELTPKITTVFGWLGIKDINHTIPYYTHIGLTDNLESVLLLLNSFSNFLNTHNQLNEQINKK
ncbi:hypothetical protein DFA_08311 [Cavenderia fasciculata]|uniref:Csf1 N-terminal domain-containing protein n=1 Tax=Cavenderia fasciculata TaxID=261658 RepID=F4Q5Q9_CACFS|nr:uncharacterized protein DFA_08311 [Cavenderia fasciculata]EGG17318.1 hypothetical protein DFA_08311 [Cavenderia fasciculata]|eukprot:XP_004355802.1 hypothetical protein DFA_08311 [Cavenderia fasciculata]